MARYVLPFCTTTAAAAAAAALSVPNDVECVLHTRGHSVLAVSESYEGQNHLGTEGQIKLSNMQSGN